MSYYPGLGKVNWAGAVSDGLNNGFKAINKHFDDEEARKKDEEDRAYELERREREEQQFEQQRLLNEQNLKRQKLGNVMAQHEADDYNANAGNRKQRRINDGSILKNEQETIKMKKHAEKLKYDIITSQHNKKQLDDVLGAFEKMDQAATSPKAFEQFKKAYNQKDLASIERKNGMIVGTNTDGTKKYKIDHPKLDPKDDLVFSMDVGEHLDGIADPDQKDEIAKHIVEAINGSPQSSKWLADNGHDEVLKYRERWGAVQSSHVKQATEAADAKFQKWQVTEEGMNATPEQIEQVRATIYGPVTKQKAALAKSLVGSRGGSGTGGAPGGGAAAGNLPGAGAGESKKPQAGNLPSQSATPVERGKPSKGDKFTQPKGGGRNEARERHRLSSRVKESVRTEILKQSELWLKKDGIKDKELRRFHYDQANAIKDANPNDIAKRVMEEIKGMEVVYQEDITKAILKVLGGDKGQPLRTGSSKIGNLLLQEEPVK